MKRSLVLAGAFVVTLCVVSSAWADVTLFATGVDSMNYNITQWSIRTDYAGAWNAKTPTWFMFDTTWSTRYTSTSGVQYWPGQSMTGTAVITDVFSQADLQAVATAGPGWVSMAGTSSPISIWEHGGQFLKQSGGDNSSWADDTYWASNEYGSTAASTVITEFTGTFTWSGGLYVALTGEILADDWAQVYVNDTLVYTTDTCAYDAVETFSVTSGLLMDGSNTLKVILYNPGQPGAPTAGPMALQLQLDAVPIPAPPALALGAIGLGLVGLTRRRVRR